MPEFIREKLKNPVLVATLSMVWNLLYALFNGVLGLYYSSLWFFTMFMYYAVLGCMRLSAVSLSWKNSSRNASHVMRHNGIGLILLAFVLTGVTLASIEQARQKSYSSIVMIAISSCTFFMAGIAVRNMILAHRQKKVQMIILRNISLASVIAGILTMQRSMLATYGDASDHFSFLIQVFSGFFAFLLIIGLGIGMILRSDKISSKSKSSGENG